MENTTDPAIVICLPKSPSKQTPLFFFSKKKQKQRGKNKISIIFHRFSSFLISLLGSLALLLLLLLLLLLDKLELLLLLEGHVRGKAGVPVGASKLGGSKLGGGKLGGGHDGGSAGDVGLAALDGANLLNASLDLADNAGSTHVLASTAGDDLLHNLGELNLGDLGGLDDASGVDHVLVDLLALAVHGAGHLLHDLAGHDDLALHGLDNLAGHLDEAGLLDLNLLGHNAGNLHLALDSLHHGAGLLDSHGLGHHAGNLDDLVVEGGAGHLLGHGDGLLEDLGLIHGLGVEHLLGIVHGVLHVLVHGAGNADGVGHVLHHDVGGGHDLGNLDVVDLGDHSALNLDADINVGVGGELLLLGEGGVEGGGDRLGHFF